MPSLAEDDLPIFDGVFGPERGQAHGDEECRQRQAHDDRHDRVEWQYENDEQHDPNDRHGKEQRGTHYPFPVVDEIGHGDTKPCADIIVSHIDALGMLSDVCLVNLRIPKV